MLDVLILTNLFAFLYQLIVIFLNKSVPFKQTLHFLPGMQHAVSPEPYEVPVYIGMIVLCSLFIALKIRNKTKQKPKKVPIFFIIILSLMLFMNLGPYPLMQIESGSIVTLIYIFFLLLSLGLFWLLFNRARTIFRTGLVYTLLFLFLAFVLFEPRMPVNNHDFSFFFGPVLQISRGIGMYKDVFVQYGFLPIIAFSLLLKAQVLNPFHMTTMIWLMYVIEFMLIFIIVYKTTELRTIALITLGSVIVISYNSLLSLAIAYPQTGAFRWLACIVVITTSLFSRITHKKFIIVTTIMTFMNLDTGIVIAIGYALTLLIEALSHRISYFNAMKTYIVYLLFMMIFFGLCMILFLFMKWPLINPNPLIMFHTITKYAKDGFGMLPFPQYTYFWLVSFFCFSAIWYGLKRSITTLLLAAHIAILGSVYFVGRSHPHNLFHIAVLVIPIMGILCGLFYKNLREQSYKRLFLIFYTLLSIIIPAIFRGDAIKNNLIQVAAYYGKESIEKPILESKIHQKYNKELRWLTDGKEKSPILILSYDESYLYYITNRISLVTQLPIIANITSDDLHSSLQQISAQCPKHLFVDKMLTMSETATPSEFALINSLLEAQKEIYNKMKILCDGHYVVKRCNILCEVIVKPKKIL